MTTMELRTSLISEVSTLLDDDELMREAINMLKGLRSRIRGYQQQEEESNSTIASEPICEYVTERTTETDCDEFIINGIKESLQTLKEIKAGRVKTRPARELLEELEEEN